MAFIIQIGFSCLWQVTTATVTTALPPPGGCFAQRVGQWLTIVCVTSLCKHNQYDNLAMEQTLQSLVKGVLSTGLWLQR